MKCLFVVAFLALVAATLAVPVDLPAADTAAEKEVEPVKSEDAKDARDKRGLLVTSYATAPISAPVAYSTYSALSPVAPVAPVAPIAYTSGLPAVAHATYVHTYPSYVSYNPHASYIVA